MNFIFTQLECQLHCTAKQDLSVAHRLLLSQGDKTTTPRLHQRAAELILGLLLLSAMGERGNGAEASSVAEKLATSQGMKAWREGPCAHCMGMIQVGDYVVPYDPPKSFPREGFGDDDGEESSSRSDEAERIRRGHRVRVEGRVWLHRECALSALGEGDSRSEKFEMPTCKHWKRTGTCAFGSSCAFSHPPSQRGQQQQTAGGKRSWKDGGGRVQLRATRLPTSPDAIPGLVEAFSVHGDVLDQIVVKPPRKQRGGGSASASSGCAFIKYGSYEQAQAAMQAMDGKVELCPGAGPITLKLAHLRGGKTVRNVSRAAVFRRWLIDTYGFDLLRQGTGVLDVAGGKGELSFELVNLSGVQSTVVEPRPLDLRGPMRRFRMGFHGRNQLFARYNVAASGGGEGVPPKHIKVCFETWRWQRDKSGRRDGAMGGGGDCSGDEMEMMDALRGEVEWAEARALAETMSLTKAAEHEDEGEGGGGEEEEEEEEEEDEGEGVRGVGSANRTAVQRGKNVEGSSLDAGIADVGGIEGGEGGDVVSLDEARELVRGCSILVGMHPDQAAQPMIEYAVANGKPFACVPCCVFSSLPHFRDRSLKDGQRVSNYQGLIRYFQERFEDVEVATLPFEGKNLVLYSRGKAGPANKDASISNQVD